MSEKLCLSHQSFMYTYAKKAVFIEEVRVRSGQKSSTKIIYIVLQTSVGLV